MVEKWLMHDFRSATCGLAIEAPQSAKEYGAFFTNDIVVKVDLCNVKCDQAPRC